MHEEEHPEPVEDRGNRWYYLVPLGLIGFWLLAIIASIALESIAPSADDEVLEVVQWVGVMGWTALFIFYFIVASRKRVSGWWVLGSFCVGLNLPLYVGLLFLRPRQDAKPLVKRALPFGRAKAARNAAVAGSAFACESCDALLNYGVSECNECGEQYRYADGKPMPIGD